VTKAELAWFAGFYDARGITTETQVRINALNLDDRLILDIFKDGFGGHVGVTSIRKRQQLYWSLSGERMRQFLEAIEPYRILGARETERAAYSRQHRILACESNFYRIVS